jgi:hypothetical protein
MFQCNIDKMCYENNRNTKRSDWWMRRVVKNMTFFITNVDKKAKDVFRGIKTRNMLNIFSI